MTNDPESKPLMQLELNEPAHRAHIIEAAIHATPLAVGAHIPNAPGAYLLLYSGDFPAYQRLRRPDGASNRSIMLGGGYPVYGGSAHNLAERCGGRHRHKLDNTTNLRLIDFQLIALQTSTPAAALYAEGVLISEFQPVWNEYWASGFGSKHQGKVRERGQRVTPWNRLHSPRHLPGRGISGNLTPLTSKIQQHLITTVSSGHGLKI